MRRPLTLLALLASVVAVSVSPAGAVTGNFTKDNVHDYVGLIAFYDANGEFLWRCTWLLLNPTTVLTAGHCTDVKAGAVTAIFWASQEGGALYDPVNDVEDPLTGYPSASVSNSADYPCATASTLLEYGYIGNVYLHGNNADVGMVILDNPIYLDDYASLAAEGSVDDLPVGTEVTVTGYGVSGEKPNVISYRERLMATAFIVNTHNTNTAGFNIQLSTNPGKGRAVRALVTQVARSSTTAPTSSSASTRSSLTASAQVSASRTEQTKKTFSLGSLKRRLHLRRHQRRRGSLKRIRAGAGGPILVAPALSNPGWATRQTGKSGDGSRSTSAAPFRAQTLGADWLRPPGRTGLRGRQGHRDRSRGWRVSVQVRRSAEIE